MSLKLTGVILIFISCAALGFLLAGTCRREERLLAKLEEILQAMKWELSCKMTPLPQLFRKFSEAEGIGPVFTALCDAMDCQISPNAKCCMDAVLAKFQSLPDSVFCTLQMLGNSLGEYDLDGQVSQLDAVIAQCSQTLSVLRRKLPVRIRNCRTLGFCAGAALGILFL